MAKIFLHALSIMKNHVITFLTWKVLPENSVDGELLHAIKSFYGADWSLVVG